ncbi:LysR family transcriptional regulator [Citrobacter portucalensis]|uniref:LysR family transcriptional regulator n=1 Tax=Citrobacter portucalensis TaxID=1639133 RepID=UPI00226BAE5F|nr:LysR family transcriptional regulator [Citrobacter portucalensis]MCX8980944.1 LysR family transcriptional regulator [Citrobacter portucalensis]
MGKLEDIMLMVEVVDAGGLSAAGRRLNLSPATMTSRLKSLEARYKTRLFNRSTRSIALTRAGEEFYQAALQVLEDITQAESVLMHREGILSGSLRISAPSDFGRQYVSPALLEFSCQHPGINTSLFLSESLMNLIGSRLDMCIRFGNLPDSNLVTKSIRPNRRVLVASDGYLSKHGQPPTPEALCTHRCLVMEQEGVLMNKWRFEYRGKPVSVQVSAAMVCNDGALIRTWALAGAGIAAKSWWDVRDDVEQGKLVILFPDNFIGFSQHDNKQVGLQFVYPERRYHPPQVKAFSEFFVGWLGDT